MKGDSEDKVRKALGLVDLAGLYVYKPPDDARNWKPCDFIVWHGDGERATSTFFEVKETKAVGVYNLSDVRPAQRSMIRQALITGIPYWLVVWWPRRKLWSISDAAAVLAGAAAEQKDGVHISVLTSRYGVEATPAQLSSTLKQALVGELGLIGVA